MQRAILITGAASGIGAATAARLAGPGVGLLLHSRHNQAGLERVAAAARAAGAEVATALGDLVVPEVAAAIGFLASPEASYITGQCLQVSGGLVI